MSTVALVLILIIIAAIVSIEAKNMLTSVIAIGTVGLGLSTSFLLLQAPDLAVILLVVEILTLTALVRITSVDDAFPADRTDRMTSVTALVFLALLLVTFTRAIRLLPRFGEPVAKFPEGFLAESVPLTGAVNAVSSFALGFRAYDALGAVLVLFLVAAGVMLILDKNERNPL